MKNKLLRNIISCICIVAFLIFGIYLGLSMYYGQGFLMNTWINGVYSTGRSIEEVNTELLQAAEAPFLVIEDIDGTCYEIESKEMGLSLDFSKALEEVYLSRNPFHWPYYLVNEYQIELLPDVYYDEEQLLYALTELLFVQEERAEEKKVSIELTDAGYTLVNTLNNRLDEEILQTELLHIFADEDFLTEGYLNGQLYVDLKEISCYTDISPNEEQLDTLDKWEAVNAYLNCGIVYDMGDEKIDLAGKIASSFLETDQNGKICFDSNGQPIISEKMIEEFVYSLADMYNTYQKELTFTSTAGDVKTIPYVTYGTEIDVEKEIEYLTEAFMDKRKEKHIPSYIREGYVRGKNDIGDTYIEVDMGNQKLYAYMDGKLIVDTDIVTGNAKKKMSTPEGVVYIYNKQRNRTLRGPGYASFVKYWMPVRGGIGLHDASWRNEFGGEIYKTNGSHGCINIPRDVMDDIYDSFEVGTPVIMFY